MHLCRVSLHSENIVTESHFWLEVLYTWVDNLFTISTSIWKYKKRFGKDSVLRIGEVKSDESLCPVVLLLVFCAWMKNQHILFKPVPQSSPLPGPPSAALLHIISPSAASRLTSPSPTAVTWWQGDWWLMLPVLTWPITHYPLPPPRYHWLLQREMCEEFQTDFPGTQYPTYSSILFVCSPLCCIPSWWRADWNV